MENGNCKMGKKQKMGNTGIDSLKGKVLKRFLKLFHRARLPFPFPYFDNIPR